MPQFSNKQSRPLIVLACVLMLLVIKVWVLRSSFQQVIDQEEWVSHTAEVVNELDLTLSATKDAETGARGYLLTGRDSYLQPYNQGVSEALEHLRRVKTLTQDNSQQQDTITVVEDNLNKRFEALRTLIREFQITKQAIERDNISFSEGKAIMDILRSQVEKMKFHEKYLLQMRSQASVDSKKVFSWVLYLSNTILALILTFAFAQISRNIGRAIAETNEKALEANHKSMVSNFAKATAGNLTLNAAGENILKNLVQEFGILAGKIYIFERTDLIQAASYGTSEQDVVAKKQNSGLLTAAMEQSPGWQIEEIPENYWKLSSGLGETIPRVLTFFPIMFQGFRLGLIELGSFKGLDQHQIKQIASLSDTIGIGLNAAQSRSQLQALLETTQLQSEELQTQQEELKSSNEELEQQARALESQQQALNIKNKELEATQRQLELRARDLERSTQYKSEFLAKMSHELRTPLNGLLILSTLLGENKEKNLTEQQRQFAKSINSAGNDLLMLINDILDLSKIEARKLTLKAEKFTLGDLFHSMQTTFDPQVASKSLKLVTELPEQLNKFVLFTDRQRLDQVLRNFISNAIKFTHSGTIKIKVEITKENQQVKISVADTGIGVPLDKQKLIFEAFEQADSSVSRQYGGTGLGLTISRELAHLLGGSITLDSKEGEGSTFSISLPAMMPTTEMMDDQAPLKRPTNEVTIVSNLDERKSNDQIQNAIHSALHGINEDKTILIVEDDDNFRPLVVDAARSYGFHPIEAADGEVALGILKAHIPAAILLDIKLPGISGLGILEMIKQMPHLRHIPVHMISALDYQQNALRMGALGYLTKPVTIDKVRSALGRIEKLISSKLRRVLLVEDDEVQSLAVSELISGTDIQVCSVKTGKEAVSRLKSEGFDCIILDLTLPDVSGFDLLDELKHLEISLPPIVIYTGKELTPEEDGYLRKFSESIIIKGARSPERLLDEVNLFLHRVESLLPEAAQEMLTSLRSQEKAFEGKTVLVVDDDIRNIFALTSALESKGLKVEVARDGVEALAAIEQHPSIDIILMDIMMPKMNGFEAIRQIRKNPDARIKALPIVALTAKAMREDHEKCIEAGASDYLPKPINLENLTTILKVWLSPKGLFA